MFSGFRYGPGVVVVWANVSDPEPDPDPLDSVVIGLLVVTGNTERKYFKMLYSIKLEQN